MPISIFQGMAGTMRLQNLIFELTKDNNLSIVNIHINYKRLAKLKHLLDEKVQYTQIIYSKTNPIIFFVHFFHVFRTLKKHKNGNRNILYFYGYPNIKNILNIIIAKFLDYKIIFDIVEDNSTVVRFKSLLSKFKNQTSLFFFRKISYIADGIIVISDHLMDKIKKINYKEIPLYYLPITINSTIFHNKANKKSLDESITVFYGGSFGGKDGLKFLLNAFDNLASTYEKLNLKLTGNASQRDLKEFNEILLTLNYTSRIKYYGYLSYDEYINLLKTSNILCMTRDNSTYANAGFPFKLGEMLATGNPVIASDIGNLSSYLINKENCILIEPGSTKAIENAIRFIIENPSVAIAIGNNGRTLAFKEFNTSKFLPELLDFFEKI